MTSEPHVRAGASGAVFLRCGYATKQGKDDDECKMLERVEVCAMITYADLQDEFSLRADNLLIFAYSFDPLINECWVLVIFFVEEHRNVDNTLCDTQAYHSLLECYFHYMSQE